MMKVANSSDPMEAIEIGADPRIDGSSFNMVVQLNHLLDCLLQRLLKRP
jgi:hypothetical protein